MAIDIVTGTTFTFQVLFVDSSGDPLAVTAPTIDIFSFNDAGVRTSHVAASAMGAPTPAETGRYVFSWTLSTGTFLGGEVLYVEYTGTDPGSGATLRDVQRVNVLEEPPSPTPTVPGCLKVSFIQPD